MTVLNLIPDSLIQGSYDAPKESGLKHRLHANELPWSVLDFGTLDLNCYPDPRVQQDIQNNLASLYQVETNQLILTRGSDEGIDLVCRLFLHSNQDALMQFPPTFAMYAFYTRLQQAQLIQCPLDQDQGFILSKKTLQEHWNPGCKIIVFCSPNNPTGNAIDLDLIATTCELYASQSVVIVDEAYIEFSNQPSATTLIPRFENLIVLRTLSKAYGLAGLRLGSIMAQAQLIEAIKQIIPPYTISSPILALAQDALARQDWFLTAVEKIKTERSILKNALEQFHFIDKIYPSEGNFILFKTQYAQDLTAYLVQHSITVRNFSASSSIHKYLRITVGNSEQNRLLIKALKYFKPGDYDAKSSVY